MKGIWIALARFCLRKAGVSEFDISKSLEMIEVMYG